MKKSSSTYGIRLLALVVMLLGLTSVSAQVLEKPTTVWTAACASDDYNEYVVNFKWYTPLVNSDNEFVLELSDEYGNFGSVTELSRVSDKNMVFNFDF